MNTTDDVIRELQTVVKQRQTEAAAELVMVLRRETGLQVQWSDVTAVPDSTSGEFWYLGYKFVPRLNYDGTGIAAVVRQQTADGRHQQRAGYIEIEAPGDLLRVLQEFEPWSE